MRYEWLGRAAASVLLGAMLSTSAHADYEKGRAAYEKGDYQKALHEWRPLAEQGDAQAQKRLGDMYANAHGVEQDDAIAIQWYRKAAQNGFVGAQTTLGLIYETGEGVPQDYAAAVDWYRKAAALKDPVGQSSLAAMYAYGLGAPKNHVIAYALYNLSPFNRFYAQTLQRLMTKAEAKAGEGLTLRLSQSPDFLKTLDQAAQR